ncbi:unnamed protein product [Leuciscus chuanchicus]
MLNLQHENFKGFIQVMIDGTNKRLDGVIKDVQELKTSLEFTQIKMEEEMSGHKEILMAITCTEETGINMVEDAVEKLLQGLSTETSAAAQETVILRRADPAVVHRHHQGFGSGDSDPEKSRSSCSPPSPSGFRLRRQ